MQRNWGNYRVIAEGKGYKVKVVTMKPDSAMSLQTHKYRKEVWVYIDENTVTVVEKGTKHRLVNKSDKPLRIIEVQLGKKCIESDIRRY